MSYSHVNNDSGLPIEPRGLGCAGGGRQGEAVGAVTKRPGGLCNGVKNKNNHKITRWNYIQYQSTHSVQCLDSLRFGFSRRQ